MASFTMFMITYHLDEVDFAHECSRRYEHPYKHHFETLFFAHHESMNHHMFFEIDLMNDESKLRVICRNVVRKG